MTDCLGKSFSFGVYVSFVGICQILRVFSFPFGIEGRAGVVSV